MWLRNQTWNGITDNFFSKRNIIFFGKKERKLVNKTALYYYGYRKGRIAEDKKKSRREKRQERNRIENDEKLDRKILLEDESDGEWNSGRENIGWMTGSCTTKYSRTTWVRGCRGTSWKTWDWSTTPEAPRSNLDKDTNIFQYFFSCFDTFEFMHIFFL